MKLNNHSGNNVYDINTYVMRGTITMTPGELEEVVSYLKKEYKRAKQRANTYIRDSLYKFENRIIGKSFSLGVTASRLIANKYKLEKYKNQNYGIRIKKDAKVLEYVKKVRVA